MDERFCLQWPKIDGILVELCKIEGIEQPLIRASQTTSGNRTTNSIKVVKDNLQTSTLSLGVPWAFYDTISNLIRDVPAGAKQLVAQVIATQTEQGYEHLRLSDDGFWRIAWEIDPKTAAPEYKYVELDWYRPPDHDSAPIVPIPVVDYISGCVSLMREKNVLPAAALLTIALEAALWDGLQKINIPKTTQKITYNSSTWTLKRKPNCFLLSVQGADNTIDHSLDALIGDPNHEFQLKAQRTQGGDGVNLTVELNIPANLAGYVSSSSIESQEDVATRGLSEAVQRSRAQNLPAMDVLSGFYDSIVIKLRNNVVHLATNRNLYEPIPLPEAPSISTLDDLRGHPTLLKQLLPSVVRLVNAIYV